MSCLNEHDLECRLQATGDERTIDSLSDYLTAVSLNQPEQLHGAIQTE